MNKTELLNSVSRTFHRAAFKLKKHSPEILVVSGVIGVVGSAVMACKATTKLDGILENAKENIDKIHECAEHPEVLPEPYTEEDIRTDFIDFCLTRLADTKSPYAVRAQCIKRAYEQMRYWPELLNELRQTLEMISCEPLSPGLRSAWRQVMKNL